MVKGKVRSTIFFTPSVKEQIEASYRADNCGSQSDFVEKAVEFYLGYLNAQKADDYLPYLLSETLDAKLGVLGDRIGRGIHDDAHHRIGYGCGHTHTGQTPRALCPGCQAH